MYGDKPLEIGDKVYTGDWFGHKIETIVRATHKGTRLVTDKGTTIVARNQEQAGRYRSVWYLYTPEVQAEWDATTRRRAVQRKFGAWGVPYNSVSWRDLPTEALERIAAAIEQEIS